MRAALTRDEGKLITRTRLLEAATRLLGEHGYAGLSASAVAREAGIAQPTFYVHFRDKEDLVRTLAYERISELRRLLREARAKVGNLASLDAVRETFRLPLEVLASHPRLFDLFLRELDHAGSPLGEQARQLRQELHDDLVADLAGLGRVTGRPLSPERADLTAEAMIALTISFARAHVEGRRPDLAPVIDYLTEFAVRMLSAR